MKIFFIFFVYFCCYWGKQVSETVLNGTSSCLWPFENEKENKHIKYTKHIELIYFFSFYKYSCSITIEPKQMKWCCICKWRWKKVFLFPFHWIISHFLFFFKYYIKVYNIVIAIIIVLPYLFFLSFSQIFDLSGEKKSDRKKKPKRKTVLNNKVKLNGNSVIVTDVLIVKRHFGKKKSTSTNRTFLFI